MSRLVERGAGQSVATAANLALAIGLARLIAGRRQTRTGPHVSRAAGSLWLIDGRAEGECGYWAAARHTDQPPASLLTACDDENLPGQPVELLHHRGQDRQEGRDEQQ